MKLYYLQAAVPLVKSFSQTESGQLLKNPYPSVFQFTSSQFDVRSLPDFYQTLMAKSAQGACLLKGLLRRELTNESRAGATNSEDSTEWLCLDLDRLTQYPTIQAFMDGIGLSNVSYIVQWSASAGIVPDAGISAHIFIMLDRAVAAPMIKEWLIKLNLQVPELYRDLKLTRTGNALHWPLDITTCQNDKLLYIAPPHVSDGVIDTFEGVRIIYMEREQERLSTSLISADIQRNRKGKADVLNLLRKEAGYKAIKESQYKVQGNIHYISAPGAAVITGLKEEREFIYFNLNGGDSWAYYHPIDKPEFIYNFKGEPAYKTQELLPDYWASLADAMVSQPTGNEYFICRDFATDKLYNGYYIADEDKLVIARASNETRLKSFMKQHGQPVGDFVPDFDLVYNPHADFKYDRENRTINTYEPSRYYHLGRRNVAECPPISERIIRHAVGDSQYANFINWIAHLIQFRRVSTVAWVLHGKQGTGKGLIFNHMLSPLLGAHNCANIMMGQLNSSFNGQMQGKLLVFIDEVQLSALGSNNQVEAQLKSYIAEPTISVRRMQSDVYNSPNYVNIMLASNKPDSVMLDESDRRYNVAEYQANRLDITYDDIVGIEAELEDLFQFFMGWKVDVQQATRVSASADREQLISISTSSIDVVVNALLQGDFEFFIDQLPQSDDPIFMTPAASAYKALITNMLHEPPEKISRDELFTLMDYCCGNIPRSPNKFTSMLKHHRMHMKKIRIGEKAVTGISDIAWRQTAEWFAAHQPKPVAGKVTLIRKPA